MDDIRDRLIDCFSGVFPDLGAQEVPRAAVASVGNWDSLATVNLVTVIEETFGVQVQPEEIEQFTSFELILDYLQQRCAHVS